MEQSLWFNVGMKKQAWTGIWTKSPGPGPAPQSPCCSSTKSLHGIADSCNGRKVVCVDRTVKPALRYTKASKLSRQIQWNLTVRPLLWNWVSAPVGVIQPNPPSLYCKILVTYQLLEELRYPSLYLANLSILPQGLWGKSLSSSHCFFKGKP